VSWNAIVAGAIAMLATALLLFALGIGFVAAVTGPGVASLQHATVGLWVWGMVAIVIGAVVGGAVTGVLRGRADEVYMGATHGLLAWGLAFVLAFGFQLLAMRDLARAATAPLHEVGTVAAAPIVSPNVLRPGQPFSTVFDRSRDALRSAAGIGWSSFFVWIVAGLIMGGGAEVFGRGLAGGPRLLTPAKRETDIETEPERERRRGEPMIPSPGT
jgi:hypothetical protein